MSLSGYEQKHVWLNDGYGKFVDVAGAVGVTDTHDGRSVAVADLWNTGALDVLVATQRGPLLLYKNTVAPDRHWIEFDLQGTRANRDAVGAQVRLVLEERAGPGNLPAAGSQRRQRLLRPERPPPAFRPGQKPADRTRPVRWPDNRPAQTISGAQISLDRVNSIQETHL